MEKVLEKKKSTAGGSETPDQSSEHCHCLCSSQSQLLEQVHGEEGDGVHPREGEEGEQGSNNQVSLEITSLKQFPC